MNKLIALFTAVIAVATTSAHAQNYDSNYEQNPIFSGIGSSEIKDASKTGFIKVPIEYIPYERAKNMHLWLNEIKNRKGHFFILEGEHTLQNGYTLFFSQLKSNLTCANYSLDYTEAYQGSEDCYLKFLIKTPDYVIRLQFDNLWIDGYNDSIYIKPEPNKEFFDVLINDTWYKYSKEKERYIKANKDLTINK